MERLKLRARIIEHFGTIGHFARHIGITQTTASNVLSGKTTPTSKKIGAWCEALQIQPEEIGIFFTPKTLEN